MFGILYIFQELLEISPTFNVSMDVIEMNFRFTVQLRNSTGLLQSPVSEKLSNFMCVYAFPC